MAALNTSLDRECLIPYHVQIKEALISHIEQGGWQPGDQLPGEPELCLLFNVSRTVIRQALKEMEYEGLVNRQKGKGTFVLKPKINEGLAQKLTGFYHDMIERGFIPVTQVLRQRIVPADELSAAKLALAVGESVIELERLRSVVDTPVVLVTSYLPYKLCPQVLHADFTAQSLYDFLDQDVGLMITHGKRVIEAVQCNEYQAKLLQLEKGAPLIRLDSVCYLGDDTPIEYYRAFHRGDRTRFEVELVRA